MGVIKRTLIIEHILESYFSMLPPHEKEVGGDTVEFPIEFKPGDEKELIRFLTKMNDNPYPLIWLMTPFEEDHLRTKVVCENLEFVLAVDGNSEETYEQRLVSSYQNILMPLLDNIKKLFSISGVIDFSNEDIRLAKFPNFGEDELNETSQIWDALKVTFKSLSFNNKCIKQINI